MQILSNPQIAKRFTNQISPSDVKCPSTFAHSTFAQLLDVDVCEESQGLRLLRIGVDSPLKRLSSAHEFAFYASMEIGDRIVAINGVNSSNVSDLKALVDHKAKCEITIYDFRTRLTVSWQLMGKQFAPQ